MEEMAIIFAQYADMICVALSVITLLMTGITLHRLKKLESGLYKSTKETKIMQVEMQNAVDEPVKKDRQQEAFAAAALAGEQEKLIDAVLDEVFP